jgi:2-oxoglutarate ferredoxin oxidoreductase subunit gamma
VTLKVRFSGFGGQGIVLAGYITGFAAIADGRNAIQNQSYGSESRGGLCKSDVVVEDDDIYDLELDSIDLLVAMSQQAHDIYIKLLEPGGVLVVDSDLVTTEEGDYTLHAVPFTDIAYQEFNRKIMGNMVMLGYLVAISEVVSGDAMKEAIAGHVPKGTEEMNLKAFDKGFERGKEAADADA